MDKQKIHYCFTLADEQLQFLRTKKYNIDRMECFMSLVTLAVRSITLVAISRSQQLELLPGQFMVDNTQLAKLWDKDRKTVPKLLEAMERLGIFSTQKVGECRIFTLHALSGWYVDGLWIGNAYRLTRNNATHEIFHKEVPAARLITIEDAATTNTDGDNAASENDKSNATTEGRLSATSGNANPQSSLFGDNGSEGKTPLQI